MAATEGQESEPAASSAARDGSGRHVEAGAGPWLPFLIGAITFCAVPVQLILVPSRILALSCARPGAATCGSREAVDEAYFFLEATRSYPNLPALLALPALTFAADRVGRKPIFVVCVLGMCADALGCALSPSLPVLLAAHTAAGLVGSLWIFLALSCAMCADVYAAADGSRTGAFAGVESAVMVSGLAGPFTLGALSGALGPRAAILATAPALLATAAAAALLLRETLPPGARAPKPTWRGWLWQASPLLPLAFFCGREGAGAPAAHHQTAPRAQGSAPPLRDSPAVRRVCLLMGLLWSGMRGCEYLLVPFARLQLGWDDDALGRFATACAAATVGSNLALAASPLRRASPVGLCALGACLSALGCVLYALSSGAAPGAFWAGGLAYSSATFLSPLLRSMLSAHVPQDAQARALGCAAALESGCALLAPLVFAPTLRSLERVGAETLSYAGPAALFGLMLPVLWAHGRAQRAKGAARRLRAAFPAQLARPLINAAAADGDEGAADSEAGGARERSSDAAEPSAGDAARS